MGTTDNFKTVISNYLQSLADNDPLFAETYKKESKNIDNCSTYIINEVKKSGQSGFADEEIFAMAVHYYDEDDIEVGQPVNGKIVVNHSVTSGKNTKQKAEKKPALIQDNLF